ncbi:aminotransferase class IV [Cetobacterium sp. SF1]|uniref:aminotransferase class IV n=1 Tax=unclassified Cetobacterium TaxID=2630983 RepID=UPI003CEED860
MERIKEIKEEGFLYGYGLFETINIKNKIPKNLEKHFLRLKSSAMDFNIEFSLNYDEFKNLFFEEISKYKENDFILRFTLIKDGDESKYFFNKRSNPYGKEIYEKGFKVKISDFLRNENSRLVYYKTLNYMENYMELLEARKENYNEVIFFNSKNYLCEGAISNIFIISKGIFYTPSLKNGLLKGIMRDEIINKLKAHGEIIKEENINLKFLIEADEIFITNSILGIMKVSELNGKKYSTRVVESLKEKFNI